MFLDSKTKLVEIIEDNYQLIPVINRFGVKLGLGDNTIEEICQIHKINEDFFLVILNTYLNEEYFPERKLQKLDIDLVIEYLRSVDDYVVKGQLHNLEKHLHAFRAMSDPNNKQLELIEKIFFKFKYELTTQIEKGTIGRSAPLALLLDLKNIIVKHISGNFNENLCYAVVFSIDTLQKDLQRHNRIREKVLRPMIEELEESGVDNWQELILKDNLSKKDDTTQSISQRELDVLKLVAQGFMNKEIADKLNISLNTVLSHRKNITSKLGIKTVSGLIFYCITHGYISSDEIEL